MTKQQGPFLNDIVSTCFEHIFIAYVALSEDQVAMM